MPNIPGIKPEVVNEMRRANRDGETYSSLEKRFAYSRPTITAACQGRHPYDGEFDEPPVLPRVCGVCRTRDQVRLLRWGEHSGLVCRKCILERGEAPPMEVMT